MGKVTELGYMGIEVSDLAAWKSYAAGLIGMEVAEPSDKGFDLRLDLWHHRISVTQGPSDDLQYLGWRVSTREDLEAMAAKLTEAGMTLTWATREEAQQRKVLGYFWLLDPDGLRTEIFYGPRVDVHKPFHPGRPMFGRFITGDQGLGHLVIRQADIPKAVQFYGLLGLAGDLEYSLALGDGKMLEPVFMHLNQRQHTVGFMPLDTDKRINHVMIEYTNLDDLGLAHDAVKARKIDIAMALGKHANDQALSFYCSNPSGWLVELGWGGRPPQAHHEYYVSDIFGHASEAKGYGIDFDATAPSELEQA